MSALPAESRPIPCLLVSRETSKLISAAFEHSEPFCGGEGMSLILGVCTLNQGYCTVLWSPRVISAVLELSIGGVMPCRLWMLLVLKAFVLNFLLLSCVRVIF